VITVLVFAEDGQKSVVTLLTNSVFLWFLREVEVELDK
jgi:hypothetical protein